MNLLLNEINKTRLLGRSRTRWIDVIANSLGTIDQNVTFKSIYNRERWRDLLKVAMALSGPVS